MGLNLTLILYCIVLYKLSFKQHLEQNVLGKAASSLYALKVLRSKGLEGQQLWDVTSQTLVARMLYASQAWWGFVNDEASRGRLEAIINKLRRQKYLSVEYNTFYDLCNRADQVLFKTVLQNDKHVLSHLLPPRVDIKYNLRTRTHHRLLPNNLNFLQNRNFINRMLFKDSY